MTGGFAVPALTAALACLLVAAAVTDLRARVIEHWTVAAIAALAPLWWWANGYTLWPDVAMQLVLAFVMLLVFTGIWAIGQMGGGDVKLIAALALWLPLIPFVQLLFAMALIGAGITLAVFVWRRARNLKGPPEVPYGVAIAAAGLWAISAPYLNQFA